MALNVSDPKELFREINRHAGHEISISQYGFNARGLPLNVAIECETCHEVLLDADIPK